jgi:hypothetical protein
VAEVFVESLRLLVHIGEGDDTALAMKSILEVAITPPNEELHVNLLRRVDKILPLFNLTLARGVGRIHHRVSEIRDLFFRKGNWSE